MTMLPESDKWRAAKMLIERHGDDAASVASLRSDEMADKGDDEGAAIWLAILHAVEELTRASRASGANVH
jgi:hypothetical protein